jgi:hypothetical protein
LGKPGAKSQLKPLARWFQRRIMWLTGLGHHVFDDSTHMSINIADTTPVFNHDIPVDECALDVADNASHGSNDLDGFSTDNESDDDDSACLFDEEFTAAE